MFADSSAAITRRVHNAYQQMAELSYESPQFRRYSLGREVRMLPSRSNSGSDHRLLPPSFCPDVRHHLHPGSPHTPTAPWPLVITSQVIPMLEQINAHSYSPATSGTACLFTGREQVLPNPDVVEVHLPPSHPPPPPGRRSPFLDWSPPPHGRPFAHPPGTLFRAISGPRTEAIEGAERILGTVMRLSRGPLTDHGNVALPQGPHSPAHPRPNVWR
ncbi:hypothetical protein PAPYR_5342 [Paratrimastix pyriformis]|uniref:Uncharacterized protein n=1 Tax=Paratrimastix pyriformis TaxID=342808 RepID=A0ABQ8UQ37_9EUKA|nr:hypothetical protein PAPYR_5342 [Paratrimastix pyriformis]